MIVPTGVILIWTGANGAIPAGFSRVTGLDATHAKGANGEGTQNVTGGAANHTHTSPAHSHSITAHTHTYNTDGHINDGGSNQNNSINNMLSDTGIHTGTSGATSGGDTSSDSVTYGSVSNEPPFVTVIFIQSTNATLPASPNLVLLFNQNSIPANWQNSDGSNATVDLRTKYIKGANTGADAGGTGGSYTNVHDITHAHSSVGAHSHVAANCNPVNYPADPSRNDATDGGIDIRTYHAHSVSLNSATQNINSFSGFLTTPETVEPAYKKLLAIANIADNTLRLGMIGLWLGTIATIPQGWFLCDGSSGTPDMRNMHLKIANTTGEIGNTGGSNTHTHSAQSHNHTANGTHTHTGVDNTGHTAEVQFMSGNGQGQQNKQAHQHNPHIISSVQTVGADYQNANTTADSSNNEPPFLTAHFIMFNVLSSVTTKTLKYTVKTTAPVVQLPLRYTVKTTTLNPVQLSLEYHVETQYSDFYSGKGNKYTDFYR